MGLLRKLIFLQMIKKFTTLCETRRFITAFTIPCQINTGHPSNQFLEGKSQSYPSIYAQIFQMICFPQVSPPKSLCSTPLSVRAKCLTLHILLDLITRIILGWVYRSKELLFIYSSPVPPYSSHLDSITFLRVLLSNTLILCFYLHVGDPVSYPYRKEERGQSTNFNFYILAQQTGRQKILRRMKETIL